MIENTIKTNKERANMKFNFVLVTCLLFVCSSSLAETQIISKDISAVTDNHYQASITPNGRYIVYVSTAKDIVAGDNNDYADIFLYDSETKQTKRISNEVNESANGGASSYPSISDDGHYIVYQSKAYNLTVDNFADSLTHNNNNSSYFYSHIYLYDVWLNKTILVSKNEYNSNSRYGSFFPKISGNGKSIVYVYQDEEFYITHNRSTESLYLYAIETNLHTQLDTQGCHSLAEEISFPDINYLGDKIVFSVGHFQDNDMLGFTNTTNFADICLYQSSSHSSSSIYTQNDQVSQSIGYIYRKNVFSSHPHISSDGRYITFESYYPNLQYGIDSLYGSIDLAAIYLYDLNSKQQQLIYQEKNNLSWFNYDSIYGESLKSQAISGAYAGLSGYISSNNQFVLFTGANVIDIADKNLQADTLLYNIKKKNIQRVAFNETGGGLNSLNIASDIGKDDAVILGVTPHIRSQYISGGYEIFVSNNQKLNHFPLLSLVTAKTNDVINIQLQQTTEGYQQFIALELPNSALYLLDQNAQLISYDGNNLNEGMHQSDEVLQLTIDESFTPGVYQVVSLLLPKQTNAPVLMTDLVKTQLSINEFNYFPSQTNIYPDDQCATIFQQYVAYPRNYDAKHTKILFASGPSFSNDANNHEYLYPDDNNDAYDLFVCSLSNGQIELVSIDENGEQFPSGTSHSNHQQFSENGEWVLFDVDDSFYLHQMSKHKTNKLTLANNNNCYIADIVMSNKASYIFYSCFFSQENGLRRAYLWKNNTNEIIEISKHVDDITRLGWIYPIVISASENVIGFSSRNMANDESDERNIYLYDVLADQLEKVKINFSHLIDDENTQSLTTYNYASINHITEDDQIVFFSYDKKPKTGAIVEPQYLLAYDRDTKLTHLLKISATERYLSSNDTNQLSFSHDGRFILFQSYKQLAQSKNKAVFGQSPYIYLYDRETELLEQIPVQVIDNKEMKISTDGRNFRLDDVIYPLTRRVILSSENVTEGEYLTITFDDLNKAYKQYIAIENSDGEIIEYTTSHNTLLFNGKNFMPWQGSKAELTIKIDDNFPPGKYRIYLLTLPESLVPDSNREQWQLGISFFEVK